MKVRCKYNTIDDIVDQNIRNKLLRYKVDGINLEKNKEYNVYGLKVFEGQMYFLIFPYYDLFIPYTYLTYFFEVIDPRMSKYFRFYSSFDSHEINSKEWIKDEFYYEKILDDYYEEIYREYKKLIDTEFPNLRMQLLEIKNNISYFSNQFGNIAGIVNYLNLEKNKWYDVCIEFINPLELYVNYFINDDIDLKSIVAEDMLIMNLKIEEFNDEFFNDVFITNLICYFNGSKIKIPIIPYHEEIKKGDYIRIKYKTNFIKINILDE
ncbi:hypothetical protein QEJ31_10985 [Pigmentibacter sp. JX0631]|uniref:hypothetical protein n=1 Tax=Pigmentibacter sp. JX0631 TaxID=2976982 RepID=UPI00246935DA|nr:hypothetical protein [Pigmentibacter sp. JX0631]WGL59043.1 hypothetical protein QEJ31_10985 [Pigmentibacter sp. JX0631]